jgi:hypothetical protein
MDRNLDILDLLRRIRMHGLALTALFDNNLRKLISERAEFNSLDIIANFQPSTLWQRLEVLSQQDRIAMNMLARGKSIMTR